MDEGWWGLGVGFSPAARAGVRPPPPQEDIKLSNRFNFSDELEEALGEEGVPILGDFAGLDPAREPDALVAARRAYGVAQRAFEHARAREWRSGIPMPRAIATAYVDAHNVLDHESAKHSWNKAGDHGSIQLSRPNRFCKGF